MSPPPEPRANPDLFGHDHAAQALADAAASDRLHHAWLLTGPRGVGKATLAFRFARWLLAGRPPGSPPLFLPPSDPTFRRVAAAGHADLRSLAPNAGERGVKMMIRVDEVRQVPRFLSLTAAEGGWRIVLVEQAEAMNAEAQNALLKTLEEPPPRALLLLTTAAPDRLLPTIRSRCRRVDLFPLAAPQMEQVLNNWLPDLDAGQRASLARISDGAPGRALELAEGEGLALQAEVDGFLRSLPHPDPRALHQLSDRLAAKRDGSALVMFFDLLRSTLATAVREAARGGTAAPYLAARPLADWASLWDTLGRLADETETLNLDRKQAVLNGLSRLASR
ncbi:DNA polymerase III subunit delta' [Pseudoroseomonas wenyumeiae]|uniref:DNA polymerase III subunit delta n=1 Tax=Teichococcus wenyumeiae TaxID=2478470 RepID=A0A3A9JDI9_9PROT|nr:DNA polymerase III subunit delta' [Pseudoroseomonas wenyumeiae]RKK04270.1 DNA polymerase III subunit delta' [Pseudoroseomonas wenyumeiae]RMI19197.1 DNA polymerase III subunit delta' [Pseudoroseomonas wenyumeiae]